MSGGLSTLVDGFTVTEDLKNENLEFYKILCDVKVRFRFIDKEVVLEDWSELIKLNDDKTFKHANIAKYPGHINSNYKKLSLYQGKMNCLTCHDPHGIAGTAKLMKNVDEIVTGCASCHEDKKFKNTVIKLRNKAIKFKKQKD